MTPVCWIEDEPRTAWTVYPGVPAGTSVKLATPLASVVPVSVIESGPPVTVIVASGISVPPLEAVTESVPVGRVRTRSKFDGEVRGIGVRDRVRHGGRHQPAGGRRGERVLAVRDFVRDRARSAGHRVGLRRARGRRDRHGHVAGIREPVLRQVDDDRRRLVDAQRQVRELARAELNLGDVIRHFQVAAGQRRRDVVIGLAAARRVRRKAGEQDGAVRVGRVATGRARAGLECDRLLLKPSSCRRCRSR